MISPVPPALPRFILLYALMYAAFGIASPFLPAFLESRGLAPEQLGIVFAAGTAMRLVSGPLAGRVADRMQALRVVLALTTAASALVALGFLPAHGFWVLLAVSLAHAVALAPTTTLADALALAAASPRADERKGFEYGWVRGTGSGIFIIGTLVSGQVVAAAGLVSIFWLQAALLGAAAVAALTVPELNRRHAARAPDAQPTRNGILDLLRIPVFRRLIVVAALVLGSHAMHDTFAVIRWSAAGIGPATASVLWSESVAAEVVVFFLLGPALVRWLTPAGAVALAAAAGIVRWTAIAYSSEVAVLALVQPLHGFTFALLHLACMRIIAASVPPQLAATAQALYAFGAVATTATLALASGWLYGRLGAQGFLAMALLCLLALPLAAGLRSGAR